jgi:hypothetical protein
MSGVGLVINIKGGCSQQYLYSGWYSAGHVIVNAKWAVPTLIQRTLKDLLALPLNLRKG